MISLKLLITQRAERIGCKNLADRFDLKTIRAIGMSYVPQFCNQWQIHAYDYGVSSPHKLIKMALEFLIVYYFVPINK
jgi:hypothetical protein